MKSNKKTKRSNGKLKSIEVFEDPTVDDMQKEYEEKVKLESPKKEEKKVDKIFGNDYNTGNIDSERFPVIQIEAGYADSILSDCYNMEDYTEKKNLLELTVEVFNISQWKDLPLDKKFSKELQPFIFNDLYKGIDGRGYTVTDMFICIAEFMDITYERVYEIAGLKMKERLINELEDKYRTISKRKISRLF